MGERQSPALVVLHQRERRAGDIVVRIGHDRANEGACEGRLACAKLSRKRHDIARLQYERQEIGKPRNACLIRILDQVIRAHAVAAAGGTPSSTSSCPRVPVTGTDLTGRRTVTVVPTPGADASATLPP